MKNGGIRGAMPSDEEILAASDIDANDIEGEMIRVSSHIRRFSEILADLKRKAAHAYLARKVEEARLFFTMRRSLEERGEKATDSAVKNAVEGSKALESLLRLEADSDYNVNRMSGVLKAIEAKQEMLISLGANARDRGDVVIKTKKRNERREG